MHTLLSSSLSGMVWCIVLFLLCFAFVHLARLVAFGQKYRKQQSARETPPPATPKETPAEQKKAPPPSNEPIYYIVERKKRTKSTFSEPKRINFK